MTADQRPGAGYQFLLVALLSLNFGIVFFDRNALSFLMPFVQPELGLSDTQVGGINSAFALTWAGSALLFGAASDWAGRRKAFLIAATVVFSAASVLTGLATTFLLLLGARMLMGLSEGSIMPMSQSLTAQAVSPRFRGLAMGTMQTTGAAFLGSFVAPIALVALAQAFGWRNAFFLAGVPGVVCALLMWVLIREPKRAAPQAGAPSAGPGPIKALVRTNLFVCSGISILLVAYMLITWTFMPLYLTQNTGLAPETMGWVMGVLGLSAVVFGAVVPFASDWLGRKPVMIIAPLFGVLLPLSALYGGGAPSVLAAAFFVGWALAGTFAMFMATIPSETVPAGYIATAMGIVVAVGEVVGGGGGPLIAGLAADAAGRDVIMWILFGLCLAASALAFGLKETAPAVVARRTGAAVAAQ
jgi:predicted MFS family arabinose efflux permease